MRSMAACTEEEEDADVDATARTSAVIRTTEVALFRGDVDEWCCEEKEEEEGCAS
jgi:hypothetical protein